MDIRKKIQILKDARKQIAMCLKSMRIHPKSSLNNLFKACILKELESYIDSDLYIYLNKVENAEVIFNDEGLKQLPHMADTIIKYDYDVRIDIAFAQSISEYIVPLNLNGMINGGVS